MATYLAFAQAESRPQRPRWTTAALHYLDVYAGIKSVSEMCRCLQRTERALRCQLHRRGLSARVREGCSLRQLCMDFHLHSRSVLRLAVQGLLRIHSAQVYAHRQPIVDSRLRQRSTLPIGTAARIMGYTHGQLIAASLERRCRLINVRFTEASIARFAAGASFDPIRARLSPALLRWLARPGGRKPVTAVIELASHSPDMCRKRRSKAPRHSAQRWQQLPDIQSLSYGCCMPTAALFGRVEGRVDAPF